MGEKGPDKAILLVDDEMLILIAMRHELSTELGNAYRYELAKDGAEGLEVIKELALAGIRVVAVISDWLMPGMKGDEFIRLVRERHPRIRTIMVSGMVEHGTVDALRSSGSLDAYFSKPWNIKKVADECRRLLSGLAG